MDGDLAPLRELIALKEKFGALLMVDEAHAVGVLGPNGRGLGRRSRLDQEVDVQMGTLSKALRSQWRLHLWLARTDRLAD